MFPPRSKTADSGATFFDEEHERFNTTIKASIENRADPYSVVFVEEVAPLVLDVEQQREHDHDVDESDEGHDDKTAIHLF